MALLNIPGHEVVKSKLDDFHLERHVYGGMIQEYRRAAVVVPVSMIVEVHDHYREVLFDGQLDLPAYEAKQILRMGADEDHNLFSVRHALAKTRLDCGFRSSLGKWTEVMGIVEIKLDPLILLPALHVGVRPHVVVAIEDDICFVSVAHACLWALPEDATPIALQPVMNSFDELTDALFDVATSQVDPLILTQQRRHICICQDDRKNGRAGTGSHRVGVAGGQDPLQPRIAGTKQASRPRGIPAQTLEQ